MLLDTHYAYALAGAPARMLPAEWKMLKVPASTLRVSAVSLWEIRLKWKSLYRSGQRKGPMSPAQVLPVLQQLGVSLLPLTAEHASAVLQTPIKHSDPFDELLLVQAQAEGLSLFTRDRLLVKHPLAVSA